MSRSKRFKAKFPSASSPQKPGRSERGPFWRRRLSSSPPLPHSAGPLHPVSGILCTVLPRISRISRFPFRGLSLPAAVPLCVLLRLVHPHGVLHLVQFKAKQANSKEFKDQKNPVPHEGRFTISHDFSPVLMNSHDFSRILTISHDRLTISHDFSLFLVISRYRLFLPPERRRQPTLNKKPFKATPARPRASHHSSTPLAPGRNKLETRFASAQKQG